MEASEESILMRRMMLNTRDNRESRENAIRDSNKRDNRCSSFSHSWLRMPSNRSDLKALWHLSKRILKTYSQEAKTHKPSRIK